MFHAKKNLYNIILAKVFLSVLFSAPLRLCVKQKNIYPTGLIIPDLGNAESFTLVN
jgi:hypothetical protein